MKIGILGSGGTASALGYQWAKAGHAVFLGSRRPDELQSLPGLAINGVQRGTLEEAAGFGEVAVFAIPWWKKEGLAKPDQFKGKVVVDATNPYSVSISGDGKSFRVRDLGDASSSEDVAKLLPAARLVKSFNTIAPADLES